MTKFLGQRGLEYYNSKLKKRIDEVEAKSELEVVEASI